MSDEISVLGLKNRGYFLAEVTSIFVCFERTA